MARARWWQYGGVTRNEVPDELAPTPLSPETRIRWGFVLLVLAVVFVFAVWPLHEGQQTYGSSGYGGSVTGVSSYTLDCGSAFKASGHCDASVVRHRRILLLELGGGALVVGLIGLELIFGARRRSNPERMEGASRLGSSSGPAPDGTANRELSSEVLDKLERLARLRDTGALTEDEFAAHKATLLAVTSTTNRADSEPRQSPQPDIKAFS